MPVRLTVTGAPEMAVCGAAACGRSLSLRSCRRAAFLGRYTTAGCNAEPTDHVRCTIAADTEDVPAAAVTATIDPELAICVAADGQSLSVRSSRTADFLGTYNTSCNCMPAQVTWTSFMETGHPAHCAACSRGSSKKRAKSMAGVKGPFEAAPKGI